MEIHSLSTHVFGLLFLSNKYYKGVVDAQPLAERTWPQLTDQDTRIALNHAREHRSDTLMFT